MDAVKLLPPWVAIVAATTISLKSTHSEPGQPWRLRDAAGLPAWFELGLVHRSRVEHFNNDYRADNSTAASALAMRTLVNARAHWKTLSIGLEIQDSRAYATDNAPLTTTNVNALELLQAQIALTKPGLLAPDDELVARAGRMTLDVGSRRLVARNGFRNTINGFTGLDVLWRRRLAIVRAFGVWPVNRLPSDIDAIARNDIQLDEENTNTLFGGAFWGIGLHDGVQLEVYSLGIHEGDGNVETNNRRFVSPGARAFQNPKPGGFDFEIEAVGQFGTSRASRAATDTANLSHRAFFGHVHLGNTINTVWAPRVVAQFDYASGDRNPSDGTNQRFDTLFGARRGELGPTGIFGPFSRSNLITPGARLEVTPRAEVVDAFVAHRLYWLASRRDEWTTTGLVDATGNSGRFLGQQLEFQVRWFVLPKNLELEAGAAHLIRGDFAKAAPGGKDVASTYVYTQITGTL